MTVLKVIQKAFRKIGVSNPTNQDKADALDILNDMLDNWNINNLTIYINVKEQLTLIVGQGTYTIGIGGDLSTTRPETILDIYLRDVTNSQDHFLRSITEVEYDDIIDKAVQTIPSRYFYAPEYPLGKLYLDYLPSDADTLLITSKKPFSSVTIEDSFTLPSGYDAAITYNLAILIAAEFGYTPDQITFREAEKTLKDIKRKNSTKLAMTTKGQMPDSGKYRYNIHTGDYR